ncbi:MAG TPA: HlyC/CorC family transporter [Proteobacteria bacterium]|nr:HlyC/CorC family transporter [Pseudomonadota bacterium]
MTVSDMVYPLSWFIGLLFLEAFFSGSEIALVAADRKKLQQMASDGHKGATAALKLLGRPTWLFSTTLLGTNLAVATNTVLTTAWMVEQWRYGSEWLAVLLMPLFVLIFGEIIPKTIFQQKAQQLAPKAAYGITAASYILYPLVWIFARFSHLLTNISERREQPFVTREELKLTLRMDEDEIELDKAEKRLIRKMFSFMETDVSRVMIPLVKVSALPDGAPVADAVRKFRETGYGRLPVYHKRIDNMVGILNAFDLIGVADESLPVSSFMYKPYYVPETKPVDELLLDLQKEGKTIAIVVNEYGGTIGMVTVEDILEEVMGEIADEFDKEAAPFTRLGPNHYLIKGRMEVSQANEQLHLGIPEGDYETIAGFILKELGFIPKQGHIFSYRHLQFIIRKAEARAIEETEVIVKQKGQKDDKQTATSRGVSAPGAD